MPHPQDDDDDGEDDDEDLGRDGTSQIFLSWHIYLCYSLRLDIYVTILMWIAYLAYLCWYIYVFVILIFIQHIYVDIHILVLFDRLFVFYINYIWEYRGNCTSDNNSETKRRNINAIVRLITILKLQNI